MTNNTDSDSRPTRSTMTSATRKRYMLSDPFTGKSPHLPRSGYHTSPGSRSGTSTPRGRSYPCGTCEKPVKPDEHATRWFKPLWGIKQKSDQMSDTKKNFVLTLHDECMTKLLRKHGRFKDVRPDYELSYSVLNPNTWREARELFAKGSLTWKEGTETLKRTAHEEPIFWLCVSCDNDASNEPVRAAEHPDKDSENFFTDPVYIHERCLFGTANAEESAFFSGGTAGGDTPRTPSASKPGQGYDDPSTSKRAKMAKNWRERSPLPAATEVQQAGET